MTIIEFSTLAILLVVGGVLFFKLWRGYFVDQTRQKLFTIRDELFDGFHSGGHDFDSVAYGMARTMLNGLIRYTHEISFTRVIIANTSPSERAEIIKFQLDEALKELPQDAKELVESTLYKMHVVMLKHIFARSFMLKFLQLIVFVTSIASVMAFKPIRKVLDTIEEEAYTGIKEERRLDNEFDCASPT